MATILIVDDHAINRQFLLTLLGYGGHRLLEAAEGAAALNLVRAERPDLVITDILMPNMDGYELVTHMRAYPSLAKTPVIFYTASYRAREARSMAQACGVQWVLAKPSEPELILRTVQEALGILQAPNGTPAPRLSASIDSDKFSIINDQLRGYLLELEANSKLIAQVEQNGKERGNLRRIAEKLSGSLGSLQAVSVRLTRLVEIGLDLAAERDPGRMLEILCRAAHGICDAKYAAVAIVNDNGIGLGFCCTRGLDSNMVTQLRALPHSAGVLGRLLSERTPCRMNGLDGGQTLGLPASHPPIHCFLGVPLASKERIYGWLYLADKSGAGDFSEVNEQVTATIASQMAAAYENLILYDEVHQHRAQLQMEVAERKLAQEALRKNLLARTMMAECNRVLVHADDEIALLHEMCLTIVDTGGYALAWIAYDGEGDQEAIKLVAQAGLVHSSHWQSAANWMEGQAGGFVAKAAIRVGRPQMSNDQAADSTKRQGQDAAHGYRSALSLPLLDGARVFGALTICEGGPHAFKKEQIEIFEQLAGEIAYGVVSLRTRRAREQAEKKLLAAQDELTGLASMYPDDGHDMESLLRNTDTAMYRIDFKHDLQEALERREFELLYQPKVDLSSGKIIGAEALPRWNHPALGVVLPARFLPVAEEAGAIRPIAAWVLRSACAQNKLWQCKDLPAISVSVNVSPYQFRQEGLAQWVGDTLRESGLEARFLELELAENVVMHHAEACITKLQELKALGVQLSIVDFGSGYSNLRYLKRFPLDRLKIDQSLVQDLASNEDDAAIIRSIILLGHSLNLKLIAEGVETQEQVAFLRRHQCDEIQGYYFGEPLSAEDFAELLGSGRALACG